MPHCKEGGDPLSLENGTCSDRDLRHFANTRTERPSAPASSHLLSGDDDLGSDRIALPRSGSGSLPMRYSTAIAVFAHQSSAVEEWFGDNGGADAVAARGRLISNDSAQDQTQPFLRSSRNRIT